MRSRSRQRGTTLIEAMVAMAVIAIGAVGTIAVNSYQLQQNSAAREMTVASSLAQDLVENMSLWAWNDARLSAGAHAEADLTLGGAPWTGLPARSGYTRAWSVAVTGTEATITATVTGQSGSAVTVYTVRANTSGVTPPP